jgi:hypothetical protein
MVVASNTETHASPFIDQHVSVRFFGNLRHDGDVTTNTVESFHNFENLSILVGVSTSKWASPRTAVFTPAFPAVPIGVINRFWVRPVLRSLSGSLNLHTGVWLQWTESEVISPIQASILASWVMVAEIDIDFEAHVGVDWDWFSTKWSWGGNTSIDEFTWAFDSGLGSWLQLSNGKVQALESLGSTNCEDKIFAAEVIIAHNLIAIAEESLVCDLGPLTITAYFIFVSISISLFGNVDANL